MKSIFDFIEGKIRRSETSEQVFVQRGEADATLGVSEGEVSGPNGTVAFFTEGLRLSGDRRVRYQDIAQVEQDPASTSLDLHLVDGSTQRLLTSPVGGEIVFATLRWVGHTILRRKLA